MKKIIFIILALTSSVYANELERIRDQENKYTVKIYNSTDTPFLEATADSLTLSEGGSFTLNQFGITVAAQDVKETVLINFAISGVEDTSYTVVGTSPEKISKESDGSYTVKYSDLATKVVDFTDFY